jgi:uncharacterized protein (DUF433 family)/DNA-binding transcriptional MerR regulator
MSVTILDREVFSEAEAARLLRVPQSTLHYWLEGGVRRGRQYRPVLRVEPRGTRTLTWAEFVEATLLRQYRRDHEVPMGEIRDFIDLLRERLGVPFPLAHKRPFVFGGRELLDQAQTEAGLDPEYCLVATVRGQLVLTAPAQFYVERVDWEGDEPTAWRPHDDMRSPVRVAPNRRFGRPAVGGISTEVIWEHTEAGESPEEIAEAFGLDIADVSWALAYEIPNRSAA